MLLKFLETGPLMVNTYILGDDMTREAAVFDPGGHHDRILAALEADGLQLRYVFNTHTHFDHVGGNRGLQEATGAAIVTHADEAPDLRWSKRQAYMYGSASESSEATHFVAAGDEIALGGIRLRVIDVRGHSRAGIGFVFAGDIVQEGRPQRRTFVICGDALFAGSVGATDHAEGNLELLIENIRAQIFSLPEDTIVLPGHGPFTTVGQEKRSNPFFR